MRERQVFLDQVSALATNKLRSELDVSFAKVNVDDAKLLLSKAQNDLQAAFAQLANLMGLREPKTYRLVEEPLPPALSTNVSDFVERALQLPARLLSLGTRGRPPSSSPGRKGRCVIPTSRPWAAPAWFPLASRNCRENYAAAGVSRDRAALRRRPVLRARQEGGAARQAAEESLRDLEDNVIRDVRIAWLNAQNAFDRLHDHRRASG